MTGQVTSPGIIDADTCLKCDVGDTVPSPLAGYDYRIKLHMEGCKGGSVSWICCSDGCNVVNDITLCTCDYASCCDPADSECDAPEVELASTGAYKCEHATTVWVDLVTDQRTITVQVHDGNQAGVCSQQNQDAGLCSVQDYDSCQGSTSSTCCGGAGGGCANSGDSQVCNYVLDVTDCIDTLVRVTGNCPVTQASAGARAVFAPDWGTKRIIEP